MERPPHFRGDNNITAVRIRESNRLRCSDIIARLERLSIDTEMEARGSIFAVITTMTNAKESMTGGSNLLIEFVP